MNCRRFKGDGDAALLQLLLLLREISVILDVPLGTVRSRLNQVKVKLAEALLKTAGLEHDQPRGHAESQTRFCTVVFDEYIRGQCYETLAGALADDFVRLRSDGFSGALGVFWRSSKMTWKTV